MKRWGVLAALVLGFGLLAACAAPAALTTKGAWARVGSAGENSAVYLTIENGTGQEENLIAAESSAAEHVELHQSIQKDDGTMSMQPQPSVPVPARGKVELKPGGLHIMLIGLTQDLKAGDTIQVTLKFESGSEQQVSAEVKQN